MPGRHFLCWSELCRNRTELRFSVRSFGCALFIKKKGKRHEKAYLCYTAYSTYCPVANGVFLRTRMGKCNLHNTSNLHKMWGNRRRCIGTQVGRSKLHNSQNLFCLQCDRGRNNRAYLEKCYLYNPKNLLRLQCDRGQSNGA